MQFSITVRLLNKLKFWNTIPTCCLYFSVALIFSSLKYILPLVGVSSKFIQRKSVDFPPPDGPIMLITSPFFYTKIYTL